MKQRAHAWVALRALKLLDDTKKVPELVELLSYYLSDIWDGAWLPDTLIVDMIYGHIFKMESDPRVLGYKLNDPRSHVSYKELDKNLTGKRLCLNFIKGSKEVEKPCWSYKGHLPNRVISLSHIAGDMLKMSDYPLTFYARDMKPKEYRKDLTEQNIKDLSLSPNFSARQIALAFFILSHYICDIHMPLHCDLRDGSLKIGKKKVKRRIPCKLHPGIEKEWESYFPDKKHLALNTQTKSSIKNIVVDKMPKDSPIRIDKDDKYKLNKRIYAPARDEWVEMVMVARTSFALSRTWIDKPYKNLSELIKKRGQEEFEDVTNRIFHDAVQSIAMIWYKAWMRYVT